MPRSVLFLSGSIIVLGALLIRSVVVGLEDGVITEEQIEAQQQLDSVRVVTHFLFLLSSTFLFRTVFSSL